VDKQTIETQLAELAILQSLRDEMRKEVLAGEAALAEQEALTDEATAQVALLNRQIAALRQQLASLSEALDVSEAENEANEVQIADLGRRLNAALATKVQELARFRSDFFGRLRELLGDRQDIRVVGDRFVFQSEVLFPSGSAELEPEGRVQLAQLAGALAEIATTIPEDIDWVLRVDGHTDRRPISTSEFPSNWELSTARAISVVKFLIVRGIEANRLAATGFGEFQPLDTGSDEIAFRRNRRIELKLTQR
jgi:chemotaxis protein MotB